MHLHSRPAGESLPAGRPITAWSAFDLGVHRAITIPGEPLPDLPRYLRRAHDDELDHQLADLSQSVMVVLTGESSTGKTRALYESVLIHPRLREWPLWYPRTADELLKLVRSGRLGGEAVLWLNETHNHLSGPTGDVAAVALWSLMDGSRGGSTVVLGTLWPQFWAEFVATPRSAQRDDHANARALLQQRARRIRVAERFGDEDVRAAWSLSTADLRLSAALSASGRGRQVIQTMAGGPALVERLEYPDDADDRFAAAIVTAAIDARRLGRLQHVSRELLAEAAAGYLDEQDRVGPPEDWFDRGLARAAGEAVLGVTALVPHRRAPGAGPADGYDLHDYLDQHGRIARRGRPIPEPLWAALLRHTDDSDDVMRLAESACQRLLYRYADPLLERAIGTANEDEQDHLVFFMTEYGRLDRALQLLRDTAYRPQLRRRGRRGGWQESLQEVRVLTLLEHGCLREARALLDVYVERPEVQWAWVHLVDLLVRDGETDRAVELLQRLVDHGIARYDGAAERLADLLADRGDWEPLMDLLRGGRLRQAQGWLAKRFAAAGRLDRLRALAEVRDHAVSLTLVEALLRDDRVTEALELFTRIRERARPTGVLLELLVRHGGPDLAIETAIRSEPDRSDESLRDLAEALSAHGHRDRVLTLLRERAEVELDRPAVRDSPDVLAELLAEHSCWLEVLKIARHNPEWGLKWIPRRLAMAGNMVQLRKLLDQGHEHAGREYVRLLARTHRMPEALNLARTSADAGLGWADDELATCLAESGRFDELAARAACGNEHASRWLVILARLGKLPDSPGLLRHGLTADVGRVTDRGQPASGS
ncbi:tetratricopeptide repeat protein [Amycolatopsis sp. cmx-8-4]|uniref:tetratricopeptide repeat protein n=1 Tax=Amycolatopsis sp. cmx-8-4 TaxID=2790947 RepID=UPI00397DCF04